MSHSSHANHASQGSSNGGPIDPRLRESIGAALGRIPSGLYVLTARYEDRRLGMLASWVQQACFEPPMVSVALAKGRAIMPLISESRRFGLCQLQDNDRLLLRKFAAGPTIGEDPFLGLDMVQDTVLGVPIVAGAMSYLECEVNCHMDVEGDHDLFVGVVRNARFVGGSPHVHLRDNGFKY